MEKACSITGYRPAKLPFGEDENDPRCRALKMRFWNIIQDCVLQEGYTRFLSGMAMGSDLLFAEMVVALKRFYPDVILEAAVPYPGQANNWPLSYRKKYAHLLSCCDRVTEVSPRYSRFCMMQRNRYLVDQADLLVAVFDGRPGGTANTVAYAEGLHKKIVRIDPWEPEK